jgi:hypothetical protein
MPSTGTNAHSPISPSLGTSSYWIISTRGIAHPGRWGQMNSIKRTMAFRHITTSIYYVNDIPAIMTRLLAERELPSLSKNALVAKLGK